VADILSNCWPTNPSNLHLTRLSDSLEIVAADKPRVDHGKVSTLPVFQDPSADRVFACCSLFCRGLFSGVDGGSRTLVFSLCLMNIFVIFSTGAFAFL